MNEHHYTRDYHLREFIAIPRELPANGLCVCAKCECRNVHDCFNNQCRCCMTYDFLGVELK